RGVEALRAARGLIPDPGSGCCIAGAAPVGYLQYLELCLGGGTEADPRGNDQIAAGRELERVTCPAVVEGEVIVLDADDAKTSSGGRPRRARLERDGQRDKGIRRRPAHRHGWIDVTVRALDQILRHRDVEYISREQREVVARREAERRGTSGGRRAERRVIDQITISGGGDAP